MSWTRTFPPKPPLIMRRSSGLMAKHLMKLQPSTVLFWLQWITIGFSSVLVVPNTSGMDSFKIFSLFSWDPPVTEKVSSCDNSINNVGSWILWSEAVQSWICCWQSACRSMASSCLHTHESCGTWASCSSSSFFFNYRDNTKLRMLKLLTLDDRQKNPESYLTKQRVGTSRYKKGLIKWNFKKMSHL